jgi:2-octaprenyl-6-methoxyphenol hydroxylase
MNVQKICIIGDGLAGISTAVTLSNQNIQIDLYGSNKRSFYSNDNRTTAVSETSFQFIKQKLNIKKKNSCLWPCKEINLFFEEKNKIISFLNFKEKNKNLMYIFQNKKLKKILEGQIRKKNNIKLINKNITDIDYEAGSILLNKKVFFYDLIILCTGINSLLYSKITQDRSIEKNYQEVALTTTVKHNSKIEKVSQFFLKEGPFAILPFNKKTFSIVWSISNSYYRKNNKLLKGIMSSKVKILLNETKIKITESIQSFPINLSLKTKYFKKNILILGDGLHSIHPLAGQGFNLVLRDIKKLDELISRTLKLGLALKTSSVLTEFCKARKSENIILGLGIDLTNTFFKNSKLFFPVKKTILNNIKKFSFIKRISQSISDKGIFF